MPIVVQNRLFLNRRPLFLNRNIRRFKKRHSQQLSESSSKEIAITGQTKLNATDATATNAATTATTNAAAPSLQSRRNSAAISSDPGQPKSAAKQTTDTSSSPSSTVDEKPAIVDAAAAAAGKTTDENDSKSVLTESYWSRKPQRLGGSMGGREDYVIDDCAEMQLNMTSYRMVFVMNKDVIFYKHNSLLKSRKAHSAVTRAMAAKFYKYVDAWCKTNVTEAHFKRCYDWFMGHDKDAAPNTTTQIQSTNDSRTPYRVFNKYRCK